MREEFRFFDNRQKYLLFVTTTNEKNIIATNFSKIVEEIKPKKPGLKIFDAGLGDGTLLMNVLRKCHNKYPTIPFLVMGKEISLEDVRLSIEKLADRFVEHPNMVFVVSNLHYTEATSLRSKNINKNKNANFEILKLKGKSSFEFNSQLNQLDEMLKKNWQVENNQKNGNPTYVKPSSIIIYRDDHDFILDKIIPKTDGTQNYFDLIIASQPYRSRIPTEQKIKYVVKPMIESLDKGGKLVLVHSYGDDPGYEIINKIWPNEKPFPSKGNEIITYLKTNLENSLINNLIFNEPEIVKYNLRVLPNETTNGIATSLIFSSWNAATYVAQISDDKILEKEREGNYPEFIRTIIKKYNGLWFNDEIIQIERKD